MATILDWLRDKLFNGTTVSVSSPDLSEFWSMASSIYIRELALQASVNLMSRAISKCEFKTYQNGNEIRGDEWYLWNVEPNRNQNSSVFLTKLVTKLMETNEALVVETADRSLLVADSYVKNTFAVYDYQFSQVEVDGLVFAKTYYMSDVLFFQLNNKNVNDFLSGLHESYGKLLEYAQKAYQKSRGQKGVLDISAAASGDKEFARKLDKLMNERFKTYFAADSAVLPLTDGYKYTEKESRTYSSDNTRDIRSQVDDIFAFYARGYGIPPSLVLGDVADTSKAIQNLLTFGVDPVVDMIAEEINRKRYGRLVLKGTKIKIDTNAILHIDLLTVATSIDKLISSGAYSINDIRKLTGDEPIEEDWAKQHWMTKNYSTVDDIAALLAAGGDPTA